MGANDYRQRLEQLAEVFLTPNNAENNIKLDNYIKKIVGFVPEYKPHTLKVFNRPIKFTSSYQNILKTDFDELLTRELSQNDYIEICKYYRIVVLQNIPIFSADMHNEAKRFKMFIDQAYNQQIILLLSAETNIDKLYLGGKGSFEFKRTISRLYEMQTESYINTIINSI
jgi:cell division protein ZapE